jgi:rhodanese-related sulfurtransferase
MKKAGFRRVRPLHGGLAAWRSLGFPTEDIVGAVADEHLAK